MFENKSIFASRTFWGAAVAILATVANFFGVTFSPADQAEAINLIGQALDKVTQLVAIGASAYAIYGRVVAKKKIGR
ncbi:hypothetical protein GGD81_001362 [Rhodobium orientis]|uniref:Holin n=1 Tax=Rhodobium orientis TaxID=34017 RepID=A0A327JRC4_9HYPH|nr:hypothetical protein [Rhodobium orientis]MBB4302335.1 hypothetical protein [Rhodobium orientis]MBK5949041.1 hypothetical protein [Rhodobium orientis]RAI29029.1 hypothetical protein CH339_04940 [Rhodobium orientis]